MQAIFSLFDATNEVSIDDSDEDEASNVDEILEPVSISHDFDSACHLSRISCFAHTLQFTVKDGFKDADLTLLLSVISLIVSLDYSHSMS